MRRGLVTLWLLCFASAALAQGWTAYNPEGGRYRVDLPAQPKVETPPITWGGEKLTMTEATVRQPAAVYLVSHVDYPDRIAMAASSDVMLDKLRNGPARHAALLRLFRHHQTPRMTPSTRPQWQSR